MKLSVKWFDGKYPQFNLMIASQEGKDPFIEVKGCRIVSGSDGEFVSGPSTKGSTGKYWNHVFMSKDFSEVVLRLAKASQPKQEQQQQQRPAPAKNGGFDFDIGDKPF
jgi:DNA-binding cell septation regulator SpoVG